MPHLSFVPVFDNGKPPIIPISPPGMACVEAILADGDGPKVGACDGPALLEPMAFSCIPNPPNWSSSGGREKSNDGRRENNPDNQG